MKTTAACAAVVLLTLASALLAITWLPAFPGRIIALLSAVAAIAAVTLTTACIVVLLRHQRAVRGELDLFLLLNQSRTLEAIRNAVPARATGLRRWLGRHLLGHDLVVGDLVEIRPWAEIRTTLDDEECLEQLPFMPEMLPMCGQRAYVFRCMHRLFDYRKTRRMRHMHGAVLLAGAVCDGSAHGTCEAACHTIWKSAWLRRVGPEQDAMVAALPAPATLAGDAPAIRPRFGTEGPCYVCQLTRLNAASRAIRKWSPAEFLRPLVAGNVAPAAFLIGWLTHLFNEVQQVRRGTGFPAFAPVASGGVMAEDVHLAAGDHVVVRSSAEIRATLDDQFVHRGLGFEEDMLKHCGHRYRVQSEVRRVIDIVTGEMRRMKTPAYILQDVHFTGERQRFNAQYEPLFWRAVWLRRDPL